jgi:hypothetical protein
MDLKRQPEINLSEAELEAIRSFPTQREVEHCGVKFVISPFDFYATCPQCGTKLKVRSFSAHPEIEDLFDAVFEWLNQPGAGEVALSRRAALASEDCVD